MTVTDMETFALDNRDTIYRLLVYRRMFTPHEQDMKYIDESYYEDDYFSFGYLEDIIDLGCGNWMIGFRPIDDCSGKSFDHVDYYKLDEIRLSRFDIDQKKWDDLDGDLDDALDDDQDDN